MSKHKSLFRIERFATEIPEPCLALKLPYPPSVNHYWIDRAIGGRVMRVIGKKGRKFRQDVANWVWMASVRDSLSCRLSVEILATMPDRMKRDIDNIAKATLDALQHAGVYKDDNQIDRLVIVRAGVEAPGGVEVRIAKLD